MNALAPIEAAERPIMSALVWEGERAPLAKAFVAAQKAMEGVKKAATNPAFKTKYADLAQVVESITPALNGQGVGVLQFPTYDGDLVGVTTMLLHESGASVTGTLHLRPTKADPQGCGSAITYARRYALLAISGCAPEDDDGHAASTKGPPPPSLEEKAISHLRSIATDKGLFKEGWETLSPGWKKTMDGPAYTRVVAEMKRLAGTFPKDAPAPSPPQPADDLGIGDDEIPF